MYIENPEKLPKAGLIYEIEAPKDGFIASMDCAQIGKTATLLGAGREKKDDLIDMTAGIVLSKKTGDFVRKGEVIAYLHTNRAEKLGDAEMMYRESLTFSEMPVERETLVKRIFR